MLAAILVMLFFVPLLSLIFFIATLYYYLSARKESREDPGSVRPEELKRYRALFILAAVIAIVVVLILWGMGLIVSGSIPFM